MMGVTSGLCSPRLIFHKPGFAGRIFVYRTLSLKLVRNLLYKCIIVKSVCYISSSYEEVFTLFSRSAV